MTVASPCTQGLMEGTHPHAVLSQLNEQRSHGLFCDITVVVEDVKFHAHRNVLAACSGYFRSIFFTASDRWTNNRQVLELADLKSEVFANILNFMYTSSVASASIEEKRCLVAAGKRLGIPFLERLVEQERVISGPQQTKIVSDLIKTSPDPSQVPLPKKTKKESHKPEEPDSPRGPRITNVFSITEADLGNDAFIPLVLHSGELDSPPCSPTLDTKPKHALSEHSYAVSGGHQAPRSGQGDNKMPAKPSHSYTKQLANCNSVPLKKRHRLRGALIKSILPTPVPLRTTSQTFGGSVPSLTNVTKTLAVMAPPSLYSETEKSERMPTAVDNAQMELDTPTHSPHMEASISIYGCEYCPEIFMNKALLAVHMELCNHEQVCLKALKGSPERAPGDAQDREDHDTDSMPDMNDPVTDVCLPKLSDPDTLDTLRLNQSEFRQQAADGVAKPGGGQRRRLYNCGVCKRVYATPSSLKRHENVHSWQRAYPCRHCNKVFALAEYRTKHEIWHTGERRYQCIFCLQTFMTYYVLKNHQKSFHGIDPRLAVRKKLANGGFKGSMYPIKLYRLLPMKFRKRHYKIYSDRLGDDQTPPDCGSPILPPEDSGAMNNVDSVLFTMPVTFMATPKMVASVMPRVSFHQPCDRGVDQSLGVALAATRKGDTMSKSRRSLISYDFTAQLANTQPDGESLARDLEHKTHNNMPFLEMTPQSSLNTANELSELSAAEQKVELVTGRLLQSGPRSLAPSKAVGGKTETYIAKPVCPGPSVDGRVLPLCQITVRIGNEAVVRRRIEGSTLFPGKRKRSRPWSQQVKSPGLSPHSSRRQKTEVPSSIVEPEPCDDPTDCDVADQLWRPYYSYKPKKKSRKLGSRHSRKNRHFSCSVASVASKDYTDMGYRSADESFSSGRCLATHHHRNSSLKATFICNVCSSTFITESGLRAHIIGLHPSFCGICSKQCPPDEAHSISETNRAGGEFICDSCIENGSCFDNAARSPPSMEKRYRCSFCPQRFLYLATKRSHERKHQEMSGNGYKCDSYITRPKNTAVLHAK